MNELYKSCLLLLPILPDLYYIPVGRNENGTDIPILYKLRIVYNNCSLIFAISRVSSVSIKPLVNLHFSSNFSSFILFESRKPDLAPIRVTNYTSHLHVMKALIFENNERQNDDRYHFEDIIWKTLVFESRKPDRKSRIERGRREGMEGTIMHLTRRRLSFRMVLLIQRLWRVYQNDGFRSPSSFFFSLFLFLSRIFPRTNERNGHATLTFHHLRHPRWHKVVEEDVSGFLARKASSSPSSFSSSFLIDRAFCSFHRYRCKRLWVIRRIKAPRVLLFRTLSIHCALFTRVVLAASDLLCRTTSANTM